MDVWPRLLASLLVIAASLSPMGGLAFHRPPWSAFSEARPVLADPDAWALVRGPLSTRPVERLAAASRGVREARVPTPDAVALLLAAVRPARLRAGAGVAASSVRPGTTPALPASASRAPPTSALALA